MDVIGEIRYTKIHQIGVGQGMNSEVFLADDPHLGRRLAVKEIAMTPSAAGWDEYHREAQIMFKSRHENVVEIYYACLTQNMVCLAMPYYKQGSLHDRIHEKPLALHEAFRVADGILSALAQVHVANVLHFDIKPSNVLFSNTGRPLLADFGQAKLMDPSGVSALPKLYPWGMAPESWATTSGSPEFDIYQVGLTVYRMYNGDPFFRSQIRDLRRPLRDAIERGRVPNRSKFQPHVPAGVRRVIRKALSVDPADRYHSAIDFQDALGRVPRPLDWRTERQPNGDVHWSTDRPGATGLEVRLLGSRKEMSVEVYTCGSARRRKGESDLWARDLSPAQAHSHLRRVFKALE